MLDDFLRRSLQTYLDNNSQEPFVLLEVGTYCGYSALRMLQLMDRMLVSSGTTPTRTRRSFHIISIDVNPSYQAVAQQLIDCVPGGSEHVHFRRLTASRGLADVVKDTLQQLQCSQAPVRFVFLDHEKVRVYLSIYLSI